MMGIFNYDYTLCREEGCKKKDTCMRYLTYRKIKQQGKPCLVSMYCPKEMPENCEIYIEVKKEKP